MDLMRQGQLEKPRKWKKTSHQFRDSLTGSLLLTSRSSLESCLDFRASHGLRPRMAEQVQMGWLTSDGYKNITNVRRIQSYALEQLYFWNRLLQVHAAESCVSWLGVCDGRGLLVRTPAPGHGPCAPHRLFVIVLVCVPLAMSPLSGTLSTTDAMHTCCSASTPGTCSELL